MEVREGEMVAVVGPVGSGKSSFLACMLGENVVLAGKLMVKVKNV